MKKFLVLTAIFAAMFLVISCGGSDDKSNSSNNNPKYHCEDGDSYFESGDNFWELYEECENGCNRATGKCNEKSNEGQGYCTKITPKWSNAGFDDEDEEFLMFYMFGSYTPRTGINSEYSDIIEFVLLSPVEANKEYDFASTINPQLYILEDWHESTEEEYEETEHDNQWNGAYLAVSGKVKVNGFDAENGHISLSFTNVKLFPAKVDRETSTWTLTGDESKCLFIGSSSFEK